jgi:chloride channel protein, CIC family
MDRSTTPSASTPDPQTAAAPSALELLRSKRYAGLLILAAIVGAPVAVVAFFFLKLVGELQKYLYQTLPGELGFSHEPLWWPLPLLILAGLIVALTIRNLPGTGGHKPAEGLKVAGSPRPIELPGAALAALATLSFGAVLGPEAPLIFIGGCLGILAMRLLKRDAPQQALAVTGAAGSFAAVSTLVGNPLVAAFLLLEVAGGSMGGALLGPLLLPGLLAAGIGTLVFVGLDSWTGFGTFSLAIPHIPAFTSPTAAEFAWAIAIGVAAAVVGAVIKRVSRNLQDVVERRAILLTVIMGVVVALAAMLYAALTSHGSSLVLFSGQDQLPSLVQTAGTFSIGALVLLVICKGIAYTASLSSFRGGPIFPSMFIGAAGGIALSHLPGLPMVAGIAMGIGAMTAVMLGLPLTAVLLTSVFMAADGLALVPLVIVAVCVAYVASAHLTPLPPKEPPAPEQAPAPA